MDRRIRTAPLMDWAHELTSGFAQMFGGYSRLDAEARRLNVKVCGGKCDAAGGFPACSNEAESF